MANISNVYVGARYVPKYEGEFVTSNSYEPLSIVSVPGSETLYLSIIPVPANSSITDRQYWVPYTVGGAGDTAELEEQVHQLSQQVTNNYEHFTSEISIVDSSTNSRIQKLRTDTESTKSYGYWTATVANQTYINEMPDLPGSATIKGLYKCFPALFTEYPWVNKIYWYEEGSTTGTLVDDYPNEIEPKTDSLEVTLPDKSNGVYAFQCYKTDEASGTYMELRFGQRKSYTSPSTQTYAYTPALFAQAVNTIKFAMCLPIQQNLTGTTPAGTFYVTNMRSFLNWATQGNLSLYTYAIQLNGASAQTLTMRTENITDSDMSLSYAEIGNFRNASIMLTSTSGLVKNNLKFPLALL